VPLTSSRGRKAAAATLAVLVLAAAAGYFAFRRVAPLLQGSGCEVRTHGQDFTLNASQAGIASTIAGVARHQALPARAVTIAYAAALQESKLQNLPYGDRDSVGVFQQRPSEGWGPARDLEDPVYATTKFFAALVDVHHYLRLPVYKAAQAVQRSADGSAYLQYQQTAAGLSHGFSGNGPRSVWCWYATAPKRPVRLAAAGQQLEHAFGPLTMHTAGDPTLTVRATEADETWAVAAWAVSHATRYGITQVRCGQYRWRAAHGESGWTRDRAGPAVPPETVEVG
jgi:hypothetical protein